MSSDTFQMRRTGLRFRETRLRAWALPGPNAQYARFIAAGGYDPQAPWWDDAARAWLARDAVAVQGLEEWQ